MKTFKFEITLTENDVNGDEFWEDAIAEDGIGAKAIEMAIAAAIEESNLMINSERKPKDVIKLIKYEEVL